ncbi:kxDL motif-containing protein CG10681-like [Gigantopelta aegis]|uniref:kxDL motif-containing protein CG10681-like n=1 Tax=Gigantopelta aegis TaxID=1735272 RepID=UPI001B88AC0E|nr:kxDL motif-containing protein CG10681-like [Gigantopelta aegis]
MDSQLRSTSQNEVEHLDNAVVIAESLVNQVKKSDIDMMVQHQKEMLTRYEKTNEMLINFNMLSAQRCETTSQDFKKHTQMLYEMKKDLDIVFKRIRTLKQRLTKMHPEAFAACSDVCNIIEVENNEDTQSKDDVQTS